MKKSTDGKVNMPDNEISIKLENYYRRMAEVEEKNIANAKQMKKFYIATADELKMFRESQKN